MLNLIQAFCNGNSNLVGTTIFFSFFLVLFNNLCNYFHQNTSSMKLAPPNTLALYSSEEGSHELGSGGGSMASLLGSPLVSPISRLARLSVKALGGGEPEPEGASEQAWENSSTHLIAL